MADILTLPDATFAAEVLNSPVPVLVDFTAVWCGPCQRLDPEVERLNAEWAGAVRVAKLDVDQNPATAGQLGVLGIPALILFKNGQPVERLQGYLPKDRILAKLKPHLAR